MSEVYSLQISGLAELKRSMQGSSVDLGVKRGLKKIGEGVRTRVSKVIREEYNLKKSDVDDTFEVIATDDVVLIVCKARPINLTKFGAKQFGSSSGKRVTVKRLGEAISKSVRGKSGAFGGVTAPIMKSKTTLLSGAFIAKVNAGTKGASNIGVFKRSSHDARTQYKDPRIRRKTNRPYVMSNRTHTPRKAIINMAFVSVATLFAGKRVIPMIDEYLQSEALDIVMHEIDFAMSKEKP